MFLRTAAKAAMEVTMRKLIEVLAIVAALAISGSAKAQAVSELNSMMEASFPPVEQLTARSDYTLFMKKSVPEALRRLALRKLWLLDPVFAYRDRLINYDDDYTFVTVITMGDTIYKVGRGLLDDDEPELAVASVERMHARKIGTIEEAAKY
jgi:hypothetical protein